VPILCVRVLGLCSILMQRTSNDAFAQCSDSQSGCEML
jgi:hypothetical protein